MPDGSKDIFALYQTRDHTKPNRSHGKTFYYKYVQPVWLPNAANALYPDDGRPMIRQGCPVICPTQEDLVTAFKMIAADKRPEMAGSHETYSFLCDTNESVTFQWGLQKMRRVGVSVYSGPRTNYQGTLFVGEMTTFGRAIEKLPKNNKLEENLISALHRAGITDPVLMGRDIADLPIIHDIKDNYHICQYGDRVISPSTAQVKYYFDRYVWNLPPIATAFDANSMKKGIEKGTDQILSEHVFFVGPFNTPDRCIGMPDYFRGHWPTKLKIG